MEEKTKFILIALIGVLVISLLFNLQMYTSKQALEVEKKSLEKDKVSLVKKAEDALKDSKRLEDKISSLNMDYERLSKERGEWQKRLEVAEREKEELIIKLRSQPRQAPVIITTPAPVVMEQPKTAVSSAQSDAYWAGILKEKTNLETQIDGFRNQLKALQLANEQLQKDKGFLDLEIKKFAREKQDWEREYTYNQKRTQEIIDKLAQELVIEKNDKFQIQDGVSAVKKENEILKRQIETQDIRKTDSEKQSLVLQKEKTDLENKLRVMDTLLKDNITQIDNFKRQLETSQKARLAAEVRRESVELAPIIVRPKQEVQPAVTYPTSKGSVMEVNEEGNFVIIDSGEGSGVRLGDTFQVYRPGQDKPIASIEVIKVRQDIAACDIKIQSSPIKTGDTVK